MTGYARVTTEIYKEDDSDDYYFQTNRLIRKDQFLITYDTRDVYRQIYHRFESNGRNPEYTLLILEVVDVTSEFYYEHTTSYTHFQTPSWYSK